ncbi:Lhr family helicase [Adlercreutzia equolifaciens]|uniref:Lhr family helicase n=1 Tax=Adlercreutzia equolifaciens TaxID=446660 RepID=UPI0026DCD0B2|nr:hypothetical protein [Adlercreutzia equolifaciens]
MESRVGDIIALGTSTWRIKEIGADRVIVEAAPGRAARLPFWHGEAIGRPYETGRARGALVRALDGGIARAADRDEALVEHVEEGAMAPALRDRLTADGLDEDARRNLAALIEAQRACTGAVPTDRRLVVETCPDETGDMRVILHSPFGRRVHEPWALAVAHRVTTALGFDPQAVASDDGIVLRVPAAEDALPGSDLFRFDSDELESIVRERVGFTALFAARFRECAARALLMSPTAPGKRAPLWQQRLKGGQLLEAARREEDFPIVLEALRECLQDVFDLSALREVMDGLASGSIKMSEVCTAAPSPFAAPLVFGYLGEHLYEGDLPHAERQASLLSVDPTLLGELLGTGAVEDVLDAEVVARTVAELQRTADGWKARGAEGVADLLRELGPLTVEEIAARTEGGEVAVLLADLEAAHRAFSAVISGEKRWAAADDGPRLSAVLGIVAPLWAQREGKLSRPLDGLAARFARTHGPFDSEEAACTLGVGVALAAESLERLAAEGRLVRLGPDRWADGAVLARLRSRSLARAREAVRPVPADAYVRFLLDRQDIARAGEPTLAGVDGVAQVIAQFEGAALPMEQWEREVLPARVPDYRPAMLDELIAAGEVLWAASTVGEAHPISFFPTDSPLAPLPVDAQAGVAEVSAAEPGELEDPSLDAIVRHVLVAQGPLTFRALTDGAAQLAGPVARTDREVAEALQRLVWKGEATSDGLGFPRAGGLAAAASASAAGGQTPPPSRRRASSRRGRSLHSEARRAARAAAVGRQVASTAFDAALAGRWSALAPSGQSSTVQAVALVESLLDRYGVVTRDIVLAAGVPGGLSMLYPVLKAMEEAGDLARGMFVEGMGPAQFAQRETVEALRAFAQPADASAPASLVALPADDPACLFGVGIPWPDVAWDAVGEAPAVDSALVAARPARREGALVVIADGSPVLWAAPRLKSLLAFSADEKLLEAAVAALVASVRAALKREGASAARRKIVVEHFNGRDVLATPAASWLQSAGLVRLPDGFRLYASPF